MMAIVSLPPRHPYPPHILPLHFHCIHQPHHHNHHRHHQSTNDRSSLLSAGSLASTWVSMGSPSTLAAQATPLQTQCLQILLCHLYLYHRALSVCWYLQRGALPQMPAHVTASVSVSGASHGSGSHWGRSIPRSRTRAASAWTEESHGLRGSCLTTRCV